MESMSRYCGHTGTLALLLLALFAGCGEAPTAAQPETPRLLAPAPAARLNVQPPRALDLAVQPVNLDELTDAASSLDMPVRLPPVAEEPVGEVLRLPEIPLDELSQLDSEPFVADDTATEPDSIERLPAVETEIEVDVIQADVAPQTHDAPPTHDAAPVVTDITPIPAEPLRPAGMQTVAEQAAARVRQGFGLANRGALYSARGEFIAALRMISQALDTTNREQKHSAALARGLRALEESDDFVPTGARLEADLNVPAIVAAHRTTVLHAAAIEELTALNARRRYYTYAQEQLALACRGERAGSMALYGLARMQSAAHSASAASAAGAAPKAMALHQAALLVDGQNYMAANELGVLLVQHGQYGPAKALLEQSIASVPQAAAWRNLSVVYAQLGMGGSARRAQVEATRLAKLQRADAGPAASRAPVQWTSPAEFARTKQNHVSTR
jgi:tetratricopeptide (TPR) repeat protein